METVGLLHTVLSNSIFKSRQITPTSPSLPWRGGGLYHKRYHTWSNIPLPYQILCLLRGQIHILSRRLQVTLSTVDAEFLPSRSGLGSSRRNGVRRLSTSHAYGVSTSFLPQSTRPRKILTCVEEIGTTLDSHVINI